MSASLVGSEMCIRDREFGAEETLRRLERSVEAHSLFRSPRFKQVHAPGCLLYTSDAADDM
eukprot:14249177-Alexandrium_andersonii.AAC.1